MHIKRKVNFKRYFFFFCLWLAPCIILARNSSEILGILIIAVATVINQLMLVEAVSELIFDSAQVSRRNAKIIVLFIAKVLILFGALFCGSHLMGTRVIIPLIYFVLMIFSLAYSIRR
jgi:hypothetical protein